MDNTVFIIDDDPSVRDALGLLLGLRGHRTTFFADAASFLNAYQTDWHGCLLIDIRMPGMNGLELQQKLREIHCGIPVVIITGHGDVASACDAFRAEAVDFLEKPLDEDRLMKAIQDAYAHQDTSLHEKEQIERVTAQMAELTPREREVMELVVAGKHNRDIAVQLGISARTVEVHKARLMAKLKAESVPQLVRITLGLNGQR